MSKSKLKENRRVTITFANDDDAKEFKNRMEKEFNFPERTSKYQVVHGTSKSGGNVFVEEVEFDKSCLKRIRESVK